MFFHWHGFTCQGTLADEQILRGKYPYIAWNHVSHCQQDDVAWHKAIDRYFLALRRPLIQAQTKISGQTRGDVLIEIPPLHGGGCMNELTQRLGRTHRFVLLGKAQDHTEANHAEDDQRCLAVSAQQRQCRQ